MKEFDRLLYLLRLNKQKSVYARNLAVWDWLGAIRNELDELADEIRVEDIDGQKAEDEIGDVLANIVSLALRLEELGLASLEGAINRVYDKINRRKPWLLHGEAPATIEEELEIWYAEKAKELE